MPTRPRARTPSRFTATTSKPPWLTSNAKESNSPWASRITATASSPTSICPATSSCSFISRSIKNVLLRNRKLSNLLAYVRPCTSLGAGEDRIADFLGFEGVAEGGADGLFFGQAFDEVGNLVDEAVLVTDGQTGHPPFAHVGMLPVGDVNAAPAAQRTFVAVIEPLQPMQVVQIPLDRRLFAVDLKRVQRFVPAGVARAFEQAERAVAEMAQERASIIDADLLDFARQVVFPLFDERLGHRRDAFNSVVEPDRRVDAVGEQIACHAATGSRDIQPPQRRAALRQVRADRPVLQKVSSVMKNLSEFAAVDDLLGERHGRNAAVVVPHDVRYIRPLDRATHLLAFG